MTARPALNRSRSRRLARWSVFLALAVPAAAAHAATGPDLNGLWQMQGSRFAFKLRSGTSTDVRGQLQDETAFVDDVINAGSIVDGNGYLSGYSSAPGGYIYAAWAITGLSGNTMPGFQYWSSYSQPPPPPASFEECEQAAMTQPGAGYVCKSFTAIRSGRMISGKVTDRSGRPAAGVTVTAADSTTGAVAGSARTAADGTYSVGVQSGSYRLTPTPGDKTSFTPVSTVAVVGSADVSGIDFVRNDPVNLSGTVVGIGNHGVQPGVTVVATGADGGQGTATTDADGRYSMSVRADTYSVVPTSGDATLVPVLRTVDATAGDAVADFGLGFQLGGTTYQTHCSGGCRRDPLSNVTVTAAPRNGGDGGAVTTGADGSWSLLLGPGDYELTPTDADESDFSPDSTDLSLHARPDSPIDFTRCADAPTASGARTQPRVASLCHPDNIDWKMPDRLTVEKASTWNTGEGLPLRSYVNPTSWTVDLFTTDDGKPLPCTDDVKYVWEVDKLPKGAKVLHKPADGCQTVAKVSRLGNYHVRATRYERVKGKWKKSGLMPFKQTVVVRDWLLTGMGDSNGSGEGNPPFFFERCNRSVQSYQFVSALYLEQHDPHSSVTFLFTACSGARIEHLVDTPYAGIRTGAGPLPPQMSQIDLLLADREGDPSDQPPERTPDAAIVSIGVNNLGFGPLLTTCIEQRLVPGRDLTDCPDLPATTQPDGSGGVKAYAYDASSKHTMRERLNARLRELPNTYHQLAAKLKKPISVETKRGGFGAMPSENLLLTQYPDFSHNDDGDTCDTYLKTPAVAAWRPATWEWLGSAGDNLDETILAVSKRYDWSGVRLNQVPFRYHGYCASDSGFVPISEAIIRRNKDGAFHPTTNGHRITAQGVIPALCQRLYKNPECDGIVKYGH